MEKNHKVLMALMGMEIGGAETHVLELCKTLKARGLDVYVVSNGGVYVRELTDRGIKHYRVPLHNKNIFNMLSAYRALKRIVLDNRIQLVHSHARIPSFLCGLLQKRLKFRFVTTAHLDFSLLFFFKKLTNWGERTLAVSDDIRDYLLENYKKVRAADITVTVNGVDTDAFRPGLDCAAVLDELGLGGDTLKIVSVSRLDKDRSLPAKLLLQLADMLPEDAQVVIVGGGDEENLLRAEAERVNARLGRRAYVLTGQRTDTPLFMGMADIFVNVSRSAMEALSAGAAVILGSVQGYIGIFDETKLANAMENNFTGRGNPPMTADALAADLKTLLAMSPPARQALGAYGREVMQTHYSLARMARDAIGVYDAVTAAPVKDEVVISGYYGYNNSGDDVLLESIVSNLRRLRPGISITVLSKRPKETRARYGVQAVQRFNLAAVYGRLRRARLLITGGGNLMQDETSTQSLVYYLWVINAARRLYVKNMLYANGIGPVTRTGNIARVRDALNRVDLITLREEDSLSVLRAMGVTAPETHVTGDAAYALPPADATLARPLLDELGVRGPYFCVSVRGWAHNPPQLERHIARFADYLATRYGFQAVVVPMRAADDMDISRRVLAQMQKPGALLPPGKGPDCARAVVGGAELVLGMRLHALIYALERGVPAIGLSYSAKVRQYMAYMNQPWHLSLDEAETDRLTACADAILADKENVTRAILETGRVVKAKAARNAELCVELLGMV